MKSKNKGKHNYINKISKLFYLLIVAILLAFIMNVQSVWAYFTSKDSSTSKFTIDAEYKVSFDSNGGIGTMEPQVISYNASINLNTNSLKKTGYVFTGWNTKSDGTGTAYTDVQTVNNIEDITLYAMWREAEAKFDIGPNVNAKMKSLARNEDAQYLDKDSNITAIKKSETEPTEENKEEKNIVSSEDSLDPIYMWYDNGTIYWWSADQTPSLNEVANCMFLFLQELVDISGVKDFDVSHTTALANLFREDFKLNDLSPLYNWNTESVENLTATFIDCVGLTDLKALKNWNTSNVTQMEGVFYINPYIVAEGLETTLSDISGLEDWDVSKVTYMPKAFANNHVLKDLTPLKNWNVSKVENMEMCFTNDPIESLEPIYKWNTSSVTTMQKAFGGTQITTLDAELSWDTSKVTDMQYIFASSLNLETANLENLDMTSVASTANIFSGSSKLKEIKTPKAYPSDVNVKIELPGTFYDSEFNAYTKLDNTSPTKTVLKRGFTITFNKNTGKGTMAKQIILADEQKAIKANTFTKSGKIFKCWNTKKDGTGTSYSNEQVITPTKNLTLYAQWKDPLAIGNTVDYVTTLNEQTLSDWKVLYTDSEKTYLILGDYLPNEALNIANIEKNGTYSAYTNENRKVIIDAISAESGNWDSLLTGKLNKVVSVNETQGADVWAMGAPSVSLWVNSWNAKYTSDKLYTAETASAMSDGLKGYYIGDSENPTSNSVDLSGKTGYNNALYYPNKNLVDEDRCSGYWLAAPSAQADNNIMCIDYNGSVTNNSYSSNSYALRPVICLPTSIFN